MLSTYFLCKLTTCLKYHFLDIELLTWSLSEDVSVCVSVYANIKYTEIYFILNLFYQ